MAYASNVLVRKHSKGKVVVMLVLDDTEGQFDEFPDEGYVFAHTEMVGTRPMITLNGAIMPAEEWYKKIAKDTNMMEDYNSKSYYGYTIGQLLTSAIWVCKKVGKLFS